MTRTLTGVISLGTTNGRYNNPLISNIFLDILSPIRRRCNFATQQKFWCTCAIKKGPAKIRRPFLS